MKMQKAAFMHGTDKMVLKEIPVPEVKERKSWFAWSMWGSAAAIFIIMKAAASETMLWNLPLFLDMNRAGPWWKSAAK